MAELRRRSRRRATVYVFPPQLQKGQPKVDVFGLPHERQRAHHLSNRCTVFGWSHADGHSLARELANVFDDELVGQAVLAKRLGDTPQRSLIGNHQCDHDGRWVARGFRSRVSCLGDLRPIGEIAADNGVEDLRRAARRGR